MITTNLQERLADFGDFAPDLGEKAPDESDLQWARKGLDFRIGQSTWRERGKALSQSYGSDAAAAEAAGVSLNTFKSQLKRDRPPKEVEPMADQLGLSSVYLMTGQPMLQADFDIEAVRLQLARGGFAPTGSTPARRAALRRAVEEARSEIDAHRARLVAQDPAAGTGGFLAVALENGMVTPPALEVGGLAPQRPSPLAFSVEWLAQQRLDPGHLAVLDLDRIGLFLIDTSRAGHRLVDRCLYAVGTAERVEIRQYVKAADGSGMLTVAPGHPPGITVPGGNPGGVVGRVVFELRPL